MILKKNPKIGALIPARLSSERLPGKHLKVVSGKPMIYHLINRIAKCRHIRKLEDIVVCITEDSTDDPLFSIVRECGASVFRGSRFDIIRRFHDAMNNYKFDMVVQANGDNPLTDTLYMDAGIEALLSDSNIDVTTCKGLPLGISSTCFTRAAMNKVLAAYRTKKNDTGYVMYFTRTGLCNHVEILPLDPEHVLVEARLTLDYPEDLDVIEKIFSALYRQGETFDLNAVLDFMRREPAVAKINNRLNANYDKRTRDLLNLEYQARDGSIARIEY